MEEDLDSIYLQEKRLGLIDFSSENDAALPVFNSSCSPFSANTAGLLHRPQSAEKLKQKEQDIFEWSGSLSPGKKASIMTPSSDVDDQLPDLIECLEPDRATRKGKCNLRKSLAWDSAFFTSAGVLDPEELSSMIKGAEKNEKQVLPGIQEDIRTSTDSISTLNGDNLTLENLEAELFEDIRASIQKSSKAFNGANANFKAISGESHAISSTKKTDLAPDNQTPTLKKPVGIPKSQTKLTPRMQGTVKAVKQESVRSQVAKSVVRTGDPNPTLPKPPRVMGKGKPLSIATAKRDSLAASQSNKIANDKTKIGTVAGKGPQALKTPVISGVRRVLPKSASSLHSASIVSSNSTKTNSATSSSADSCGSVSSDSIGKVAAVRKKIGDRNFNHPPSGTTLKTPSKTATRTRISSGNSAVSAFLMSSKISSSISPASSISEWSSVSSSSSCTINQRSNKSKTSFDATSCRSLDNDTLDLNNYSNSQILDGHKNEGTAIPNGSTRKSATQTGNLSRPASVRPSGLRMPSPKIGFFDGVKSVGTPNGTMLKSLTFLPKSGVALPSPNRSSNTKPKVEKLSHARTVSALARVNPQQLASPTSSGRKLLALANVSSSRSDAEGYPISSLEVNDGSSGESCLKVEEVGGKGLNRINHTTAAFGAVMNENLGVLHLKCEDTSLDRDGVACLEADKIVAHGDT